MEQPSEVDTTIIKGKFEEERDFFKKKERGKEKTGLCLLSKKNQDEKLGRLAKEFTINHLAILLHTTWTYKEL